MKVTMNIKLARWAYLNDAMIFMSDHLSKEMKISGSGLRFRFENATTFSVTVDGKIYGLGSVACTFSDPMKADEDDLVSIDRFPKALAIIRSFYEKEIKKDSAELLLIWAGGLNSTRFYLKDNNTIE